MTLIFMCFFKFKPGLVPRFFFCKPQIEMSAFKSTLLRLSKRTVYIINAEIKNLDHNHDLAAFQVHKFALRHRFEESA